MHFIKIFFLLFFFAFLFFLRVARVIIETKRTPKLPMLIFVKVNLYPFYIVRVVIVCPTPHCWTQNIGKKLYYRIWVRDSEYLITISRHIPQVYAIKTW